MGIPLLSLLAGACRPPEVTFPAGPIARTATRADYDTDGNGRADFFCLFDAAGRIDRIAYDRDGDGRPDHLVHLDALDPRLSRHLVLVLDGIPFDVLSEFHEAGNLRLFPPPAVLVPPYPVMTDLALEDAFGYVPCAGFEAKYYDRSRGKVVGGTWDYLLGRNEPFARIIAYRQKTPFQRAEELVKVKGFGKKKFDKLKPFLAVSGATSLKVEKTDAPAGSRLILTRSAPSTRPMMLWTSSLEAEKWT
jgi:hypothetical protein